MDEKIYSLLEKMYIDIIDIKKEQKNHTEAIGDIRSEQKIHSEIIADINNELKIIKADINNTNNSIARLENELTLKTNSLFDGYKQNFEIMNRVEEKVDRLSVLVEQQELEIKVIKQVK